MKRVILGMIILVCFVFTLNMFSADATYVGSGKCKMCHKSEKSGKQFPLWQERKHSKAFSALTSEKAVDDAKKKGMDVAPADNPECLKCHSPLYEKAPELKEEGVTCEACHGAGSAYKKMSTMKDHAKAVAAGMIDYSSADAVKNMCLTCHEKAHDKPFDFDAAWAQVKHAKPDK